MKPTWTIAERMAHHKVPGASVSVIHGFQIDWARVYGVAHARTKKPVTSETVFQAASISKLLTSVAALRMAASGLVPLDADVNGVLRSWRLRPAGDGVARAVTLRHLLGHTAGVTVPGFPGYPAGAKLPTLGHILDGVDPANTAPVRAESPPGQKWQYSGGGYCIVQQLMVDVSGKPFPVVMQELIFDPLGMRSSSYAQPLPSDCEHLAAAGHGSNGRLVKGKWYTYPELAAAGLWSTAPDLARFLLELQLSLQGRSNHLVPTETAQQMLTATVNDGFGLGVWLFKKGCEDYFGHLGANQGYRGCVIAHRTAGCGAVVLTNSDSGDRLIPEILAVIAAEYEWPGYFEKRAGD